MVKVYRKGRNLKRGIWVSAVAMEHGSNCDLTDPHGNDRTVVSARIWLNCYLNDHSVSLGTGRPLLLQDDESVQKARLLLTHPMASETDLRLISCIELMAHKGGLSCSRFKNWSTLTLHA